MNRRGPTVSASTSPCSTHRDSGSRTLRGSKRSATTRPMATTTRAGSGDRRPQKPRRKVDVMPDQPERRDRYADLNQRGQLRYRGQFRKGPPKIGTGATSAPRSSTTRSIRPLPGRSPSTAFDGDYLNAQKQRNAMRTPLPCARREPRAAYADCTEAQMMAMSGWTDLKMPAHYITKARRDKLEPAAWRRCHSTIIKTRTSGISRRCAQ